MDMTEKGDKLKLGSSEWLEAMNQREAELDSAKANRPKKVNERLDWEATDREDKARRASHPAGHERSGLPVGTSTAGENTKARDPGR